MARAEMKMRRAIIIAKGRVQRVGYRDLVADHAMDLRVVGYVENQPDGTVKIVAEAEDEALLDDFIMKIQPDDDPLIRVTQVDVEHEKASGEFKRFEIRRGSYEEETGERRDTAAKSLKELIKTTAQMNENLGNKIDAGREENKRGFATLAQKQDLMLGKQDLMIGKQEETIGAIGEVAEKIDRGKEEIVTEIKSLREDLRSYMENKFARIEQEIGIIKAKIGMV